MGEVGNHGANGHHCSSCSIHHSAGGWYCHHDGDVYGSSSGEIEDWDGTRAVCTEELDWSVGDNYAVIVDQMGDLHGPWKVVPGTEPRSMQFVEGGADAIIYDGTERERTRYAMGPANSYAKLCRVISLQPKADNLVQVRAVVEDNRVHYADAPYLVGSGGTGGTGSGRRARYMADGTPPYPAASDAQHSNGAFYADEGGAVNAGTLDGYKYDA